jgi:hypothetical protein
MKAKLAAATVLFSAMATPAFACTLCHSDTATEVRHEVLHNGFLSNAAAIAAPLPILLGAIVLMSRSPKPREAKGTE